VALSGALAAACAHGQSPPAGAGPGATTTHLEMEPIKITAVKGPEGMHIESYDAADLFEQGSKALSEKRYDEAVQAYSRLLQEFSDPRYTRAALYNSGLALQGKKDWVGAIARFKALADGHPLTGDAKDALFQIGATYAELANWPASAQTFAQILERKDLSSDDRLEALGRRGYAQFQLKDLDTAERTFREAVSFFRQVEAQERLETDYFVAWSQYHLGQVSHERFRAVPLRLPEAQMSADLDEKGRQLLIAQRHYIDTMKIGNPSWAAASGFQAGSLYEELYDAFMRVPVPPELIGPAAQEKREIYYGELRKKIRVLLEKSIRIYESNLLMMERYGVQGEWRDKSKLAYSKIQRLLDPSYRAEFADPGAASPAPAAAPPLPAQPSQRGPSDGTPADGSGDERERKPRPAEQPVRQIL
jgi:TolA-binding protein